MKITRLSDNLTEILELSLLDDDKNDQKYQLFDETLHIKYEATHSFFFTKYFTIFTEECTLCSSESPTHLDGEYNIDICRDNQCINALGIFDDDHHPVSYLFLLSFHRRKFS